MPNAVIPKSGRLYLGSYDLLGLTAGYAVSDNFMLIAGGALPTPDDWGGLHGEMFGAYSIGAKGGVSLGGGLDVALGYQWGTSIYDQQSTDALDSKITVNAPYLALSYGDDDGRLSATVGYAFKHHSKPNLEFVQNAMITAFGCFATRPKSESRSESPSPSMMMPSATGSPMVVNADPMATQY